MYSRYQGDEQKPIRLPEHYGGSAFAPRKEKTLVTDRRTDSAKIPVREEIEEKVSPAAQQLLRAEATPSPEETRDAEPEKREEEVNVGRAVFADSKAHAPSALHFSGLRKLLGGEDADEQDRLLLLGLILLLSRSSGDSDILLWLSLLLLCG